MTTTMRCPECGSSYVAGVARCIDCDVELVGESTLDEAEIEELDDLEAGAVERSDLDDRDLEGIPVRYELHELSAEARSLLEQLVAATGIARVWEGSTLVVDRSHEGTIDELIEHVEAAERPALDPDAERVVYEVAGWTADQLTVLTDALGAAGVAYEFDAEGDLAVQADDEERVEAVLDDLDFGAPDDAPAEPGDADDADDGMETAEILSDLFVACDRLQHSASDHEGILGAVGAAARLDGRALPFGYSPSVWNGILEQAAALSAEIEDDRSDDEAIEERARELRSVLRDYV